MSAPFTLPAEKLPLFIDSLDTDARSIVDISRNHGTGGMNTNTVFDNKDIFTLVNPVIHISGADNESTLSIIHPWAKDVEGDRVRLAFFAFDSMKFIDTHYNVFTFSGWLTTMSLYNPFESNEFTDAVKLDTSDEPWANNGYPFSPPNFQFEEVKLPLKVDVHILYGDRESMNEARKNRI